MLHAPSTHLLLVDRLQDLAARLEAQCAQLVKLLALLVRLERRARSRIMVVLRVEVRHQHLDYECAERR